MEESSTYLRKDIFADDLAVAFRKAATWLNSTVIHCGMKRKYSFLVSEVTVTYDDGYYVTIFYANPKQG